MANELQFESEPETGTHKEWGMHNGVVVLAALGLVGLSVLVEWLPQTDLFAGAPLALASFFGSMGFVLDLAAGSVIGMLVATRMLQAHVGARGARKLAFWGVVAVLVALLLQVVLLAVDLRLQDAGRALLVAIPGVANLVTGTMAVGAAMVALAFVGRLRT